MSVFPWPTPDEAPELISRIAAAQSALDLSLRSLGDDQARRPSGLPGWSRGHVLTHLARHAESVARMLEGVPSGRPEPQYFGGAPGRAAEIEAGAGRPAAELAEDVRVTGQRAGAAMRGLPPDLWTARIAGDVPATKTLVSRWREIEIHRVDLGLGHTSADWPAEFVARYLPQELAKLPARAPGVAVPPGLPEHAVLAWLVGRGAPELPELPAWA